MHPDYEIRKIVLHVEVVCRKDMPYEEPAIILAEHLLYDLNPYALTIDAVEWDETGLELQLVLPIIESYVRQGLIASELYINRGSL